MLRANQNTRHTADVDGFSGIDDDGVLDIGRTCAPHGQHNHCGESKKPSGLSKMIQRKTHAYPRSPKHVEVRTQQQDPASIEWVYYMRL
jgi:hypothetical protein